MVSSIPENIRIEWSKFAGAANWDTFDEKQFLNGMTIMQKVLDEFPDQAMEVFSELLTTQQASTLLGKRLVALNFWANGEFSPKDAFSYYSADRQH